MSRYLGSVCKICRREREKLVLKGERCSKNCTLDRKRGKNPPGMHAAARTKKMSDYARHLREKQKARRIFGLTEEQFRHYFARAEKLKGLTGENLFKLLELRLDNVIYRLGFAASRKFARQLVDHGKVLVNEKKINLPGYQVKPGDKVLLQVKMKENTFVKRSMEVMTSVPAWLSVDKNKAEGTVVSVPMPSDFSHPIDSQLIVELYSK